MKRRFLAGTLAVALLFTNGCGKKEEVLLVNEADKEEVSAEVPGWQKYASEPVTLDWYINYSWFVTGWGNNLVSQKITEDTGVTVNFIVPKGSEQEKLNSLISTDTLPDIITLGWWESAVNEMVSKDMVCALNELADQYDPYFYQVADKTVLDWNTTSDGNVYMYPCSSTTPQDLKSKNIASNQTFLVRKDIYEAIGSPDMTTVEGFSQAVRKAKEMFPEVDGEPLIPIGAHEFDDIGCTSFDSYLMNYLRVPFEKDGVYYDRHTDEEYLRWLKAFRQLGQEGYLSDCIFVDNRTQMSEKIEKGQYFCMLYQRTDMADQQKILYNNNPDSIYIAVEGPRNSKGEEPVLPVNTINGWTVTLISKNCKNPDRAIAFMEYLISERGQKLISIGIEGETYDVVDGQYVIKPEVEALLYTDRRAYDMTYGADNAYWMLQNNVMQSEWMPKAQDPLLQMEEWTYKYATYLGQYEIYVKEESEAGIAKHQIELLWSKTLPQLLLAESDERFDEILAEFVEKRADLGFDMLIEEETRQVEENKKRLGLE
ncbi:MAG: extracellular solute-binding protein [Bacteroidaceae bacterium]|nr:extracellular solute-binding protein [Bacteroidaceae bacterium]